MLKRFFPNEYMDSVFKLDLEGLKKQGIKGVLFDIDNTLVPYDVAEPTKELLDFFEEVRKQGFKIALVSNNTEDRVVKFNEKLKFFTIHKSRKPLKRSFYRAMKWMDLKADEMAIVGDQIFTDVYGGNRSGLYTILVVPVSEKDEWITKVKRGIEKRVIEYYVRWTRENNGGI